MLTPNLTIFVFFIVMNTSDMTVVKENLAVGGSITLYPKMQDGALYLNDSVIAVVEDREETFLGKRFRDKFHWNKDSGLYTITGLQRNYSGIYKLEDKTTSVVNVTLYHLTVYDPAPMPAVKVSDVSSESCSLVCFIENDDETVLYWYKGEKILNQTSTVPSLSLTVDMEALNSSYSCVAANPANNKTLSLNITAHCSDTDNSLTYEDSRYWWLGLVVLAVIIALVVIIIIKRTRDRTPQVLSKRAEGPLYAEVNIVERTDRQERNSVGLSEIRPPSNLTTVYDTLSLRHMNETDAIG